MKRIWGLAILLGWAMLPPAPVRADSAEDQKISGWLSDIDRASEKGDFEEVQTLRMRLADYSVVIGRNDLAAKQYELLLAGRPGRADRVRYYKRLGKTRVAMKDYGNAIAAFEDALHDNPKDWEANLELARAFAAADIDRRAIESYERCIKLRPQESASYEELARVYEKEGFLGKAITYYNKALALETKPEIYLSLADCYVHQKNIPSATSVLAQGKARLPRAEYDVRLGEIYQSLGDIPRAAAAWEEALKSDEKRDDVRLKLTLIYDQLRRRSDTDRLFRELLKTYPKSPLVHYFKALVLCERGERVASRQEASLVEQLAPTELVAHYNQLLLDQLRKPS